MYNNVNTIALYKRPVFQEVTCHVSVPVLEYDEKETLLLLTLEYLFS